MAVYRPTNLDNTRISVFMKDGRQWLNRDITDAPFGEHETVVSFWNIERTALIGVPFADVERYEFTFDSEENEDNE